MKKIKKGNELLLKGYEIDELKNNIKNKLIREHQEFLTGLLDYIPSEKETEEDIKMNGYLFTEEGIHIPITYHTKSGKTIKTTLKIADQEIKVNIEEV